jgi:hypothetical protein
LKSTGSDKQQPIVHWLKNREMYLKKQREKQETQVWIAKVPNANSPDTAATLITSMAIVVRF